MTCHSTQTRLMRVYSTLQGEATAHFSMVGVTMQTLWMVTLKTFSSEADTGHKGGGGKVMLPKHITDYSKWCVDPDATINSFLGQMPCSQPAVVVASQVTGWFPD